MCAMLAHFHGTQCLLHTPLCTQGKVRRIRMSPFHKGSGDAAAAATKPAAAKKVKKKAESSADEVRAVSVMHCHVRECQNRVCTSLGF